MSWEMLMNEKRDLRWDEREAERRASYQRRARRVLDDPHCKADLEGWLAVQVPVLRVLHAISAGYGWGSTLRAMVDGGALSLACEEKRVRHLPGRKAFAEQFVLTEAGDEHLRHWSYLITPLTQDAAFAALWRQVTDLEPRSTS